jgi:hypothetical protein
LLTFAAAGLALSPSNNVIVVLPHKKSGLLSGGALTVTLNQINNQPNGSFILGGTTPTLSFQVTGATPNVSTYISYTVSDETGQVIAGPNQIPITTNGSGNASPSAVNAHASKLGYYRVDANMADGTILYPTGSTLGTLPPGFVTYAVMNNPDSRYTYSSSLSHFGIEDQMSGSPSNSTVPSSVLAYLGVRWVGYLQQQWAALEPIAPNTFSGTLPISYWNTTASVTPTNASWQTYNVFYFTAAQIPAWAQQSGTCGSIETSMCALNSTAVSELPTFAAAYATAAKAQFPSQTRYYQILWETYGSADWGGTDTQLKQYFDLVYSAIHTADSSAVVAGITMFPSTENAYRNLNAVSGGTAFYNELDAISMHPYEATGWPPELNNGTYGHTFPTTPVNIVYPNLSFKTALDDHYAVMLAAGGHAYPMIGTEHGYSSEQIDNISSFNPTVRANVDLGLLEQAQADIRQTLIFLGEGGQFDTLFKIADFWVSSPSAERANLWGVYFTLDSGNGVNGQYGSTYLGPKPAAPAYSAMTWILDGYDTSNGVVPGLTGTQTGYSFTRTVPTANTIWALWDYAASSTASVAVPAGPYQLCDWMGNCTSHTSSGTVSGTLTGSPLYIIQ